MKIWFVVVVLCCLACRTPRQSEVKENDATPTVRAPQSDTAVSILNPEAMDVGLDEFPSRNPANGDRPFVAAAGVSAPPCYRFEFDFDAELDHAHALRNGYWMGVAARIAYDPEDPLSKFLQTKMGMTYVFHLAASGWSYDTQGYYAELSNQGTRAALLSFRGTNEKIDFFTDLRASPVPFYGIDANGAPDHSKLLGHVHKGFANALDGVWPAVYKSSKTFKGKGPIFIAGHSLGGALATLAAARLMSDRTNFDVRGVFTYGSPRVGGTDFSDTMNRLTTQRTRILRFVNSDDAVAVVPSTPVPPSMPSWWHVGELQWFDLEGKLYSNLAAAERASTTVWTKSLTSAWVSDHKMTNYLPKLEKLFYPGRAECQG